ncbi:response regulator transcription factor [Rubellimicrobium roseum]|uniref:Response regulator transcription factor n=1 Tax=Rubellimicrobium roseum TaxID=687525 RepID=A0A5C4NBG6_9RHOB|nr:response regulator [Rubellimicrobium roseum]TNC66561.1 response regulator transcription factor [Rubellimicrobium roseum]
MTPLVHLIDDDEAVLRATVRLLRSAGYECAGYATAELFLKGHDPSRPGCVVLDLGLPDMHGLIVQDIVGPVYPVIILTGTADVAGTVQAMKKGPVEFLTKPFLAEDLLEAVRVALERDAVMRLDRDRREVALKRLSLLTPREREVLAGVVAGKLNKQIAWLLGMSEKTVKVHRGRVMDKLEARSVPDLLRTLRDAGVDPGTTT